MARHKGLCHDEVAHRWAQNTEGDHAAGHNIYFSGDTIYSYGSHFPIAHHVENPRGEVAVLFTTGSYSASTTHHCSITRRAINHLKVFDVPCVKLANRDAHSDNMKHYQRIYDGVIDRAERCGANSYADIDHHIQAAENTRQAGADYAAFYDLNDCVTTALKVHVDWLKARYARLTSPEATAERERKAERRRELEARQYQDQIELYCRGEIHSFDRCSKASRLMTGEQVDRREIFERDHYTTRIAEWAAGAELDRYNSLGAYAHRGPLPLIQSRAKALASPEQLAQRHAFDLEAQKEQIAAWRQGGTRPCGLSTDFPIMLRAKVSAVLPDTTVEIETSWGVRFLAEEARVALRYIQAVRKRGETWHSNGDQAPKLGYYKIDKITANGDVRAGCHLVPWTEIETLAIELGWIEETIKPAVSGKWWGRWGDGGE